MTTIEPEHLGLMAAGAAGVFMLFALVVGAFALLLNRHEVRELRLATEQHAQVREELASLRRLTLNAITARSNLEADLQNMRVTVEDIHRRVTKLEGEG